MPARPRWKPPCKRCRTWAWQDKTSKPCSAITLCGYFRVSLDERIRSKTGDPMKITEIEAIPFAVPYKRTVSFGNVKQTHAEHLLVRVKTDEGLVGQSEA